MTALLSPRELEILGLIRDDRSNPEIAYELGISEQTVKHHLSSILHKLNVRSRTTAVIFAVRMGLLSLVARGEQQPDVASAIAALNEARLELAAAHGRADAAVANAQRAVALLHPWPTATFNPSTHVTGAPPLIPRVS